jgi:hypothetical protein
MKINRLKIQFDERKRKLIVSGAICSAKNRFFPVNLLSPDSIQGCVQKCAVGIGNGKVMVHPRIMTSLPRCAAATSHL